MSRLPVVLSLAAFLWSVPASAEPVNAELVCRPDTTQLSAHELLRSLSLDLRGLTPTMEEYESVTQVGAIPVNLIDEWLDSEEFLDRTERFHRAIFWNNLSNLRVFNVRTDLSKGNGGALYRPRHSQFLRGYIGYNNVSCLDEPAEYTTEGAIIQKLQDDGSQREGWVMITPYWAPDTQVKVCALDAQESELGVDGAACDSTDGYKDPGCGCGEGLLYCDFKGSDAVRDALARDLDLRVREVISENRPWTDLLTDTSAFVNGPLVHYLRHQDKLHGGLSFLPHALPKTQLPDIPYTETDTWEKVELSSIHSGVLTSPAYLLRFQTNRARANKFYTDFLCAPFVAPAGGLPPSTDEEALINDLQERPGCSYCHKALEPASSYWGRWKQSGTGYLAEEAFPTFSEACYKCGNKQGSCIGCGNYFTKALSNDEKPYFGYLKAQVFRKEQHMTYVDDGPEVLVYRSLVDHRLPTCLTNRVATWLFGRHPIAEEEAWIAEVAQQFVAQGYDFKGLVKALITDDMYRSVR